MFSLTVWLILIAGVFFQPAPKQTLVSVGSSGCPVSTGLKLRWSVEVQEWSSGQEYKSGQAHTEYKVVRQSGSLCDTAYCL